jgi:ABC-type multidrug transport system permease subunit
MVYYPLGGTGSPRKQVLAAVVLFGTLFVVGTLFFLVYELFGYVPRWLIGIVIFSAFAFFMVMTAILRKDVKYDDD